LARPAAARRGSFGGTLAPVTAILLGTGLLYLGYGLQSTLVPLRASAEGFNRVSIGLLGSAYYGGFVAGCLFAPYLIIRAGHIRVFAAMMAVIAAASLVFPLWISVTGWFLLRTLIGFCFAGVVVIIESWLNDKATNANRGLVMSIYIIVTYATIMLGQLGVTLHTVDDFALFAVCGILLSVASVPVTMTRTTQPAPIPVVRFRPRALFAAAPAAFAGTFTSGILNGSMYSLGVIYAIEAGIQPSDAAFFVAASVLGGALGQYPFGRLSDFVDRRLVLLFALAGTTAGAMLLALLGPFLPAFALVLLGLATGLFLFPVYSVAAAHAYDRTRSEDMVETSAALLLIFGAGSALGPIAAAFAMRLFGAPGLFLTIGTATAALALFVIFRVLLRKPTPGDERTGFDIFSTAPVGGALTPGPIPDDEPALEVPFGYTPPGDDPPLDTGAARTDMRENA
jgi:MFS family permease